MGASGTTTIDFGTFPGKGDTSVTVTGQAGIGAGSLVEAWIMPTATADHSVDEHWIDPPRVVAGNIVAGTGFTIYGIAVQDQAGPSAIANGRRQESHVVPALYGLWTVGWVWN